MIPESYGIDRVDVSALTAFSGNPRTHSDTQLDQIAASIREFGWTNPILVDAKGTIIAGHGRLAAATRLGLDQVPVIRLGHLSDAQHKALVIADNQLALNAGWDEVALSNLVRELDAEKFELDLLGFDSADLDRYLSGLDGDAAAEADEGELPEVPVVPTSRPGDLWILGNHRLLCGDATVVTDVERLMDGQLADMAALDPPYNVDYANAAKNKTITRDRRILNDGGATGKGANLTAAEVDGNFHGLATRLVAVETNPAQPAQIEAITSSGSALTITMDNGDIYGPLPVPAVALRFMGSWVSGTAYMKNDVVRYGNDVYYISADHTSGATFLLTQTIGGIVVYQLMFDGDAAARSSVGPVFDNETHSGISYAYDLVNGDVTSTVDFAVGRAAYFEAVRDFLLAGSHTGVSFLYDFNTQAVSAAVEITQYSDELAQDAVAAALSAGTHAGISFSYNDAANSLSAAVSQIAFTWASMSASTPRPSTSSVATSLTA